MPCFAVFSFTPFGVPILVLGIVYMIFARRWLAANDSRGTTDGSARPNLRDWIEQYGLAGREHRVRVMDGSTLIGRTFKKLDLRRTCGADILAIERKGRFSSEVIRPLPTADLRANDVLLIDLFDPTAFGDFARLGVPFTAIVLVVSVLLVPWLLTP
jgi:di/tricarboxylate transporter